MLKSYVESFDAPIVALTGTQEEVAQAAKVYRVYYAKHPRADGGYDMDHSAVIYAMDPEGRFTAAFTSDSTAQAIAERLQKLLSQRPIAIPRGPCDAQDTTGPAAVEFCCGTPLATQKIAPSGRGMSVPGSRRDGSSGCGC